MEIGNQIKALRSRRGITQEALAQALCVTAQAVSKWERNAATPDIELLPAISAYFGVTIDELFAISDDTRMERIQNMLWDVRFLDPAMADNERQFLLDKARREPENGDPHRLLAEMENHLAREHHSRAEEYAKEALRRNPNARNAHGELLESRNGFVNDWCYHNHSSLIEHYKAFVAEHPDNKNGYLHLLFQLLDDYRLTEAEEYLTEYEKLDDSYRIYLFRGMIRWYGGDRNAAFAHWAEMEREFPDEWCVWQNIGDYLVRSQRLEEALVYYRKALDIQSAPRMCDPIESIAQVHELMGNIPAAIAAWEEELVLFETEYHFSEGETADIVRREIIRLEAKLNK